MSLYKVPLIMDYVFLGFWDGDNVSQLPYVGGLMFSLSEPCELLFCFVLLPLGHELW